MEPARTRPRPGPGRPPSRRAAAVLLALALGLLGVFAVLRDDSGARPPEAIGAGGAAPVAETGEALAAPAAREEEAGADARTPAAPVEATPAPVTSEITAPREDELSGRVIDAQGAPLPGARVELLRGVAREFSVLDLEAAHATERIAETETDERGEFRFELARGMPVDVRASAPGLVDATVPDRHAGEFVEIELSSGYLLHGRITRAEDGSPVEGARCRVFRMGGPMALARESRSASDGTYEVRFTFPDRVTLAVDPIAEQSSDWIQEIQLGPDGTAERDVVVERGIVVEGCVTDAVTGVPIQGAVVGEGWTYNRSATTDAQGEYRLLGFGSPGYGELFAKARGYGEVKRADLPGAEHGFLRVDFALQPGHRARGRVLDPDGVPIEGAYVAAVASQFGGQGQETDWVSGRTDAGGRFTLESLTPGLRHALLAKKPGHATHVLDFPPSELVLEETDLGDVVLTPPALVAGRVVDADGAGLAEVEVTLRGSNVDRYRLNGNRGEGIGDFYVETREARTDANGNFSFGDVAAGHYSLQARKRGWAEVAPVAVEVEQGVDPDEVLLRLGGGVALRGRVVDEDGAGVHNAIVAFRLVEADGPAPGTTSSGTSVRTDAEGAFEIRGLAPGTYRLDVYPFYIPDWDPDAPWLQTTLERVHTEVDDLAIVLEKGEPITGVLLDADGKPLANHVIRCTGGVRTTGALVTTDAEGEFSLAVPRGTVCDLEVRGPYESDRGQEVLLTQPGVAAGTRNLVLQLSK